MNLINKYDKLAHFIGGMIMFFLSIQMAISIMVMKEIYDCYKVKKTGFDINDIVSGIGGYLFINGILKLFL